MDGEDESAAAIAARAMHVGAPTSDDVMRPRTSVMGVELGVSAASLRAGQEVSTSGLTAEQRAVVRRACQRAGLVLRASLTLSCRALVVRDAAAAAAGGRTALTNTIAEPVGAHAKLHFAARHQIPVLSMTAFTTHCETYAATRCGPSSRPAPAAAVRGMERVVLYCSPPALMTPRVQRLITVAGARATGRVTQDTTHVLVLTAALAEALTLRAGLECLSRRWLEACVRGGRCVEPTPYRVATTFVPVLTFTGFAARQREALLCAVRQAALPCQVQDALVIAPDAAAQLTSTTHLIVARDKVHRSAKVRAVWRRYMDTQLLECCLVDVAWVEDAVRGGVWGDWQHFAVALPRAHAAARRAVVTPHTRPEVPSLVATDVLAHTPPAKGVAAVSPSPTHSLEALLGELELPRHDLGLSTPPGHSSRAETGDFRDGRPPAPAPVAHVSESQMVVYARQASPRALSAAEAMQRVSVTPPRAETHAVALLLTSEVRRGVDLDRVRRRLPGCAIVTAPECCTHLVVGKLTKTEPLLCCVAAGRWVLKPSFLHASIEAGHLVDEAEHEWCAGASSSEACRGSTAALLRGCALQRRARRRPFEHWHVTLCCSSASRAASFERVLRCGGCDRVRVAASPEEVLQGIDHGVDAEVETKSVVLADPHVWASSQLRRYEEGTHGGRVLRMDYLVDCLGATSPCASDFVLDSASVLRRSRAGKRVRDVDEEVEMTVPI